MRVGLDVTPAVTAGSGLRRYTEELWRALVERDDVEVSAFALGRGEAPRNGLPVRRVPVPLRLLRRSWAALSWPPAEIFAGDVQLVHSIALRPAPTRGPSVQTIHDLLPVTHPHLYPEETQMIFAEELAAATSADLVVTTCRATAEEITRVSGIQQDRIAVAAPGTFLNAESNGRRPLDEPYILVVGQITPRKGLDVLAQAAALLGERCPLIVSVGPDWWHADEVRKQIAEADTLGRMRLLGPVDDATLARYYRGAMIACHVSRAEGFGMTCLEAMSAGLPLVATGLPSVRELTDGAARLVPVDDAPALADALGDLVENEALRRDLAERGLERARAFTWPAMAEQVVAAYRRVLA